MNIKCFLIVMSVCVITFLLFIMLLRSSNSQADNPWKRHDLDIQQESVFSSKKLKQTWFLSTQISMDAWLAIFKYTGNIWAYYMLWNKLHAYKSTQSSRLNPKICLYFLYILNQIKHIRIQQENVLISNKNLRQSMNYLFSMHQFSWMHI